MLPYAQMLLLWCFVAVRGCAAILHFNFKTFLFCLVRLQVGALPLQVRLGCVLPCAANVAPCAAAVWGMTCSCTSVYRRFTAAISLFTAVFRGIVGGCTVAAGAFGQSAALLWRCCPMRGLSIRLDLYKYMRE